MYIYTYMHICKYIYIYTHVCMILSYFCYILLHFSSNQLSTCPRDQFAHKSVGYFNQTMACTTLMGNLQMNNRQQTMSPCLGE